MARELKKWGLRKGDRLAILSENRLEWALADFASLLLLVTLLWSAKESALKALHVGLRLDTTCLDVKFVDELLSPTEQNQQDPSLVPKPAENPDKWRPLHIRYLRSQSFRGWWRQADHVMRTVVSALPLREPIHSAVFFPEC